MEEKMSREINVASKAGQMWFGIADSAWGKGDREGYTNAIKIAEAYARIASELKYIRYLAR